MFGKEENVVNLHDYEPVLVQLAKEGDVVFVQQLVKNVLNKWEQADFKGKVIKVEYDEENVEYIYHVQIENSDKVIKTTDVWKY